MNKCNKCLQEKPASEFGWKNKEEGVKASNCKACHRAYSKVHYVKNAEKYKTKARLSTAKSVAQNKLWILQHLQSNPCVDCGNTDVEVLQFDHIELIGNAAKRVGHFMNYSQERLKKEVSLCQVRCANCHVRRTRKQMGWFRISG